MIHLYTTKKKKINEWEAQLRDQIDKNEDNGDGNYILINQTTIRGPDKFIHCSLLCFPPLHHAIPFLFIQSTTAWPPSRLPHIPLNGYIPTSAQSGALDLQDWDSVHPRSFAGYYG